jgi:hypothetical protein
MLNEAMANRPLNVYRGGDRARIEKNIPADTGIHFASILILQSALEYTDSGVLSGGN